MPTDGSRVLHLARHAEPAADGSGLTPRGRRQAELLGRRLAGVPISRVVHGPLPRASETARVVAEQLPAVTPLEAAEEAGDYVPHVPGPEEVRGAWAESAAADFDDVGEEEARRGAASAATALDTLAGPPGPGRQPVELVVTHAFTIAWLLRDALGAPPWRWWGQHLHLCHAGLTVLRYLPDRPPSLVMSNDLAHLPPELRWTGFPAGFGDHL